VRRVDVDPNQDHPLFREAQNCFDKKTLIFFFALQVLSGKFGSQFLRFRAAKTFFFGITVFLYQKKNPVAHLGLGRQFCASLSFSSFITPTLRPSHLYVFYVVLALYLHYKQN
jgi:hypothetical protein